MTMYKSGVLEPAYILHARNYSNTSVILDLLSRDAGRYSVVSRGARSLKSRLKGRLQPFTPLLVASIGRGELKTATTIDFPGMPHRLIGEALMLGLYVNELLYRLLGRFDPVPGLYGDYEWLLRHLSLGNQSILAVRRFEFSVLEELGYAINFEYDARDGQSVVDDRHYRFVVHEGFHSVPNPDERSFTGADLQSITAGDLGQVDERKLRYLTRLSLAELLGEKPLKSRALFRGAAR